MPLRDFPISYLLPAEVATFTKSYIPIITRAPETATLIHSVADELKAYLLNAEQKTAMRTASQFTTLLSDADDARDIAYRKTLKLIDGLRGRKNQAKADAAERSYQIFVKHNVNLYKEPYAVESHYLNALIEELNKPENQADLILIDAKEETDDVAEKQAAFENLFNQKNETTAQNITTQLSILVQPMRERITELQGLITIEERRAPEAYKTIIEEVNQLITGAVTIAKARQTRKDNNSNNNTNNNNNKDNTNNNKNGPSQDPKGTNTGATGKTEGTTTNTGAVKVSNSASGESSETPTQDKKQT